MRKLTVKDFHYPGWGILALWETGEKNCRQQSNGLRLDERRNGTTIIVIHNDHARGRQGKETPC